MFLEYKNKEDVLYIIDNYENHEFTIIYNILKKYDQNITIDDIFKNKAFSIVFENNSIDKKFPNFEYSDEDFKYLKKFEIGRSIKWYAKLDSYSHPKSFIYGRNLFGNNPLRQYDAKIDPNDSMSLVSYLLNANRSKPTIVDRYNHIMEKVPNFDVKKEVLKYYEHEVMHNIQPVYKKGDDENFYTLCCDFKIPTGFYKYEIDKHGGCPNCGVKICIENNFFHRFNLIYDLNDLFKVKRCVCRKNAYGFFMDDGERAYTCIECIRKLDNLYRNKKHSNEEVLFLEESCMISCPFGGAWNLEKMMEIINKI